MAAILFARASRPGVDCREVVRRAAEPLLQEAPGQWEAVIDTPAVAAGMIRRGACPKAGGRVLRTADVSVLMDGFLSNEIPHDNAGTAADGDQAAFVARTFQEKGPAGLESLSGSFVLVIVDHAHDRVVALTDRSGSRPMFVGDNGELVLLAPEPKAFRPIAGMTDEILPGSILSLALNAFLFGESSYWRKVTLLGPARTFEIDAGGATCRRYWTPTFRKRSTPSPDELEHAVRQCVVNQLRHFQRPVLALSGGVDSRVILATARRAGLKLPTVTWTYDAAEGPQADFAVGRRIAEVAGVPNEQHRLSDRKLAEQASRIVYGSDGLAGYLGAFADRECLAQSLAERYDAIVFGDQCYRGEREIRTAADALERVGVRMGPRVSLVKFLMRPDAARACLTDYRRQIDALLADIGESEPPHDLHDRLYWQVRVPRLLTGPKALWRMHLEVLTPLLDVPMLNLAERLPVEQRAEKTFLREGLRAMAPDLASAEFSTVHSRTKWKRILRETGDLPRYIVETLLDPLPAFDEWFDRAAIEIWLKSRVAEARARRDSVVSTGGPFARMRRRIQSTWVNRAFNARVVINLLTLRLWFHHFGSAPGRSTAAAVPT